MAEFKIIKTSDSALQPCNHVHEFSLSSTVQSKFVIVQKNERNILYCTVWSRFKVWCCVAVNSSTVLKTGFLLCFLQHCPWLHPPLWGPWLLQDQLLQEGLYLLSLPGLLFRPKAVEEQSQRLKGLRQRSFKTEDGTNKFEDVFDQEKANTLTGLPETPTEPGSPASPSSPWERQKLICKKSRHSLFQIFCLQKV